MLTSAPCTVDLADPFYAVHIVDLPAGISRNFDDLEKGAVTIGLCRKLFHDLHQLLVVAGDLDPKLIQTRFIRGRRTRPIGGAVWFCKGLLLSQFPQPQEGFMAQAEFPVAGVDDDLCLCGDHMCLLSTDG